jgi:leucyl/phenylalanyl-tRNA--protein transferase
VFPWYSPGQPVLWWAPDPREVLIVQEFEPSRSLRQSLRKRGYEGAVDRDFEAVIRACAAPRAGARGTWITNEMRTAYLRLHELGIAHSIETWRGSELVGGLYGVELGRIFFGESMFSRATDASKVALVHLVERCRERGIEVIDCQLPTPHLKSLGSRSLPRSEFMAWLARLLPPEG